MYALRSDRTTRRWLLFGLFLLASLLGTGIGADPASAQQPASAVGEFPARQDATTGGGAPERKSPGRAVLYSVAGTALLTPVAGVGLVVGPAFGHFYAGDSEQAWTGIAIRFGGAGAFGLGGVLALGAPRVGWGLLMAGALVVGGSALFDIVTAWHSAKDFNEAHNLSARVTPRVGPQGKQVGLTLHVSL